MFMGHCAYCGKKAINNFEIEHFERIEFRSCDCPTALEELDTYEQIDILKNKIPRENQEICKRIKFEAEMEKIKKDYPDFFE